jgi:threonine/homoserine/homoserine lactone efflux protein
MIAELAAVAGGSFVLSFSGALMPGPVLAATIAGTQRKGFWYGPGVVLGHAILEVLILAAIVWSLKRTYALDSPWAVMAIAVVGAAVMAWMGVDLIRQALRPAGAAAVEEGRRIGAVAAGIVTTALNPYWYVWWIAAPLPLIVAAVKIGWLGVLVFYLAHESGDLLWYALVSFGVAGGRRFLDGRPYKVLLIGCAVILFGMVPLFLELAVKKWIAATGG